MKRLPVPEKAPAYLRREDFLKLVSMIREPWIKEIVLFAVSIGMRRSEITNLTWDHVDLARGVVTVETTSTFHVKAGKRRTVPLGDAPMEILRRKPNNGPTLLVFTLKEGKILKGWLTHLSKKYVGRVTSPPRRFRWASRLRTGYSPRTELKEPIPSPFCGPSPLLSARMKLPHIPGVRVYIWTYRPVGLWKILEKTY